MSSCQILLTEKTELMLKTNVKKKTKAKQNRMFQIFLKILVESDVKLHLKDFSFDRL